MTDRYVNRGVRALVLLHERELRSFLATWRRAKAADVQLPASEDPAYGSLETLLTHVLGAARHYVVWACEKRGDEDPGIDRAPAPEEVEEQADAYLEHLLAGWRRPLRDLTEQEADRVVHDSAWGTPYCLDAMLEHAVAHPMRHAFQLEELMA